MERLWLIEWNNARLVPEPRLCPDFEKTLEVVVADTHFVVVRGTWDEANQAISGYPYWGPPRIPKAGRWVGAGGDTTYIDDTLNVVENAETVLASLSDFTEELAFTDADTILENLSRTF